MTIEFPCLNCQALLRTSQQKAGESITCPVCDEWLVVPQSGSAGKLSYRDSFEAELAARMQPMSERPLTDTSLAAPSLDEEPWSENRENEPDQQGICVDCGQATVPGIERCSACLAARWSGAARRPPTLSEVVTEAWEVYTRNLGICFFVGLLDMVLSFFGAVVVLILAFISAMLLQVNPGLAMAAFLLVLFLGMTLLFASLAAGNFRFFLALTRGEPAEVANLVGIHRNTGRVALAGTLYWGLAFIGLCCGVIPGLLVLTRFWPHGRLIVDRDYAAMQSLKVSGQLTRGRPGLSWGVSLIHLLVLILTAGIPFLGPILAFPFAAILYSVTYLFLLEEVNDQLRDRSDL